MDANTRYSGIARLLDERDYVNARTMLLAMRQNRDNQWYYYSAVANLGLGYTITALDLAKRAKAMNPKPEYDDLIQTIRSKIDSDEDGFDRIGPPLPKSKSQGVKTFFKKIGSGIVEFFCIIGDFFKGILELIGLISESGNKHKY